MVRFHFAVQRHHRIKRRGVFGKALPFIEGKQGDGASAFLDDGLLTTASFW